MVRYESKCGQNAVATCAGTIRDLSEELRRPPFEARNFRHIISVILHIRYTFDEASLERIIKK